MINKPTYESLEDSNFSFFWVSKNDLERSWTATWPREVSKFWVWDDEGDVKVRGTEYKKITPHDLEHFIHYGTTIIHGGTQVSRTVSHFT